jgi:DNA-binding LacI/PurR family transcriptional regulator
MVPVLEEFAADVLSGIASYAFEQGVETSMLYLPMKQNPPADLVSLLRERRCDAALLLHTPPSLRQIQDLVDSGIPVMLLANQSEIVGLGYVDSDSQAGARQLMRHLFDLGHERIGFLAGEMLDNYDHQQRQATYQHCMKQAGLKIQPNWIVPHQPTNHASEAGYRQALTLLENDASITAIFANNDTMAYGAIWACEEMGRKVPHDISVVGFDDYRASSFFNPPLTTIRQPITTLGYEAAKSVDLVVRGITDQLLQRVMNCELIVRQSSSRANHKP